MILPPPAGGMTFPCQGLFRGKRSSISSFTGGSNETKQNMRTQQTTYVANHSHRWWCILALSQVSVWPQASKRDKIIDYCSDADAMEKSVHALHLHNYTSYVLACRASLARWEAQPRIIKTHSVYPVSTRKKGVRHFLYPSVTQSKKASVSIKMISKSLTTAALLLLAKTASAAAGGSRVGSRAVCTDPLVRKEW